MKAWVLAWQLAPKPFWKAERTLLLTYLLPLPNMIPKVCNIVSRVIMLFLFTRLETILPDCLKTCFESKALLTQKSGRTPLSGGKKS
jgi:hypothetical protein